jgi:hypothetical protein
VIALGAVILVQLALASGYLTALDTAILHRLPVAVAGPPQLAARLSAASDGKLDVRPAADDADAIRQIEDRDVYGALLPGGASPRLLIASAASVPAAQALTKIYTGHGKTVLVEDIKPLPAGDPHGNGPAMIVVAWALGGYLGAMLIGRLAGMRAGSLRQLAGRLVILAGYAVASAAAMTAVADAGLGVLTGHPLALIGIGTMFVLAVACLTCMLQSVLRLAGILVSVVIIILVGNPSAGGGQIPPQMMNAFWRTINLVMPNPAAMNALRDYQSFGGHAAGTPLLTIALWAVVPVLIMGMLAALRHDPAGGAAGSEADLATASGTALAAGGPT